MSVKYSQARMKSSATYFQVLPSDILKLLLNNYLNRSLDSMWMESSIFDKVDFHKHVFQNSSTTILPIAAYCSKNGYLSILKWIQKRSPEMVLKRGNCAKAAEGGQLEVLQWLRSNGAPWAQYICCYAAYGGHLEVIQWCRANGAPWDPYTCFYAAGEGHLEVVQWCRANGAPWDENTCASAALGGHLEVLKWARANDAPWNENTCSNAAWGGHLEVLKWCRAKGCTMG